MRIQTKRISKKTYLTVLSTILVLVTMIGTSFGFLMKVNETDTTYATGVLSVELVTNEEGYGETINLNNTVPMTDAEGMSLSPYKFKITNTGSLDYQFDLKLVLDEEKMTQDGCANNTLSFSNVKIQVNDESPVLLDSLTDSILISDSILKAGKSQEVSIRIWLDENTTNDAIGKHFHAKLATDGYAIETEIMKETFADQLANLYTSTSKTTVTNNSIDYEYAPSISMMADVGGNIRYYGATPDNYIYFNCSDYSNQSDATCEKWRIIGVFDGKVKIMRNEVIGEYSWDTSVSGVNSGYGINQWGPSTYTDGSTYEGADLMKLLNPGYESNQDLDANGNTIIVNNSLYYNSESGSCYNGQSNAYTSCNFSSTGIKNNTNNETKNMISNTVYYLGGYNSTSIYPDIIYKQERGSLIENSSSDNVNRTLTWTGKIGLPYPSDYGYAADLAICQTTLGSYDNSTCISNNWMKSILGSSSYSWLITSNSDSTYYSWRVRPSGSVNNDTRNFGVLGIVPVLYLNSNIIVDLEVGTGDENDPYRIVMS